MNKVEIIQVDSEVFKAEIVEAIINKLPKAEKVDEFLTQKDIMQLFKIKTKNTVVKIIKDKKIPEYSFSGFDRLYKREDVLKALQQIQKQDALLDKTK